MLAAATGLALSLWGCGGGGGGGGGGAGPGPGPGPGDAPPPPQGISAAPGVEALTVSWDNVAGADSYNIYWSSDPAVSKTTGSRIADVTSPHLLDGLTFGVTCYVVVTAVDNAVEGTESAPVSVFVLRPAGAGRDVEQYFDGAYNSPNAATGRENYDDRSRHPLTNGTTPASLLFGGSENCLGCHGAKAKGGGAKHYANECLKCHFENVSADDVSLDPVRHGNGVLELAAITGNGAAAAQYAIGSIMDYDNWCLQCHSGSTVTLGGIAPSGKTVINPTAVANGRHRQRTQLQTYPVGCISCHHPHGRGNTRVVRENPQNRRSAGTAPRMFGVYPNDNTGGHGSPGNQWVNYRARVDNDVADAADENEYCNVACHYVGSDGSYRKDKMVLRDETTGNYILTAAGLKLYLVNGVQYTRDDILNVFTRPHGHVNGEIIPTDNMVRYYAEAANVSGPSFYQYPGLGDANPAAYVETGAPLPFFPDYVDGSRDFTNAYSNMGVRIKYRFTCSTCHDPHGTTLPNTSGLTGYPDLRLTRLGDGRLCARCHL